VSAVPVGRQEEGGMGVGDSIRQVASIGAKADLRAQTLLLDGVISCKGNRVDQRRGKIMVVTVSMKVMTMVLVMGILEDSGTLVYEVFIVVRGIV
jgi:hypothetical protein